MWTNYALWPTFSTYRSTPTSLGHARRYFIYTLLQWDGESSGGRFKRQEREKCDASGRLIHQIFSSLSQQSELCDDAIPPTRVAIIETDHPTKEILWTLIFCSELIYLCSFSSHWGFFFRFFFHYSSRCIVLQINIIILIVNESVAWTSI